MIDAGHTDRAGRRITLRPVDDDNWRAVAVRLSYHPDNVCAARLYTSLGFTPTGAIEDDELVAELRRVPPGAGEPPGRPGNRHGGQPCSRTDRTLPAGSVNQAIAGPCPRMIPFSSCGIPS